MSGLKIPFTGLQKQYNNLRSEILDVTDSVLRSGRLMDGNHTAEFENWLAKKNNKPHAITVHSGTNALEIIASYYYSILTTRLPKVIIPSMTFRATANAWIRAGWEVIVADCDQYGMMDIDSVHEYHNDALAVCLVGLYGNSLKNYRSRKWHELRTDENWLVIEDAAQHWLSWDCRRIGPAAAISFDPMKNLGNYGNGGAVVTNVKEIEQFAKSFRAHGKGDSFATGSNSRMSEIDCATMMVKAKHIDEWQERRRTIGLYWMERLANSNARSLIDSGNCEEHCYHKFVIEVDNRDTVMGQLNDNGIETKVHYAKGINELPYDYQGAPAMLSRSSSLAKRVISLPIYPELSDLEVEYTIDQVLNCVS